VSKFTTFAAAFAVAALSAAPAMAQGTNLTPIETTYFPLAGPLGAGLVIIGAAFGIGKLAASALESMARQPEVAGSIQTAMIIAAALIEGATFYALFICSTSIPPLS
jgi:F-type H+-transporting ATPase subunit c